MRGSARTPIRPASHHLLEGWQDTTNGVGVAGWAWDRATPDVPVTVAIYDGSRLLATVTANQYRKDLENAGIGTGHHAFMYSLSRHIRDRKSHAITVRIAGTEVTLRDPVAGTMPQPVTRHDGPPPIPHFSLSPLWRWWYFTALHRLPFPAWRPLALILGGVRLALDRQSRVLNVALLRALGMPTTPGNRWRIHWARAYQRQADLLLLAQGDRLTSQQERRGVQFGGHLPPGGAILVSVHHNGGLLAAPTFAARSYRLGTIIGADPVSFAPMDVTLQTYRQFMETRMRRSFGARQFSRREGGRKGLRLLAEGGYLMLYADEFARQKPFSPLLGRAMTVPRGAVWFAQHSGKPIIPYMVVPEGLHWRLWVGTPVAPTPQGLCNALESCIRQAPGSWQRFIAMAWLAAPLWNVDPPR